MNAENILYQKSEIIKKYGAWTAHNIQLAPSIYTIDDRIVGDEIKLRRIVQIISDHFFGKFEDLRILDLACLEGLYAVELARHGAEVVGIEGRQQNIQKAMFAKDVLSLENLKFVQDDVRNLNREKYGAFDVVLCLGILYHLECPDAVEFIRSIGETCKRIAIFDTHVSVLSPTKYMHEGVTYLGEVYHEHNEGSTSEERECLPWASIDNITSFWFSKESLNTIIMSAGFTTIYECHIPPEPNKADGRVTLIAIKGYWENIVSCPQMFIKK